MDLNVYIDTVDNVATISGQADGEPQIEIRFLGIARHLTRRAKAEVVMAARQKYVTESYRLSDGRLGVSDVWLPDGSIGREAEEVPVADQTAGREACCES